MQLNKLHIKVLKIIYFDDNSQQLDEEYLMIKLNARSFQFYKI